MKKSLKRYTDFINESEDWLKVKQISELRQKFCDAVKDFIDDNDQGDNFSASFSDLCNPAHETTPMEDYDEMQKEMDKKGFDFETIRNLFNEWP
jgi:hypothetical protein